MKTLISLSCFLMLLFSCGKKPYVYNVYNMAGCLEGENQEPYEHDVLTFDQGFFYYENCQGYKEIDGVKVNWLEDKDCPQWMGIANDPANIRGNKVGNLIDSLTYDLIVPQRFFLVFLDKRRVLYFTNYEAAKYFKKRVKSIYKDLDKNQIDLDSIINTHANYEKLDSVLQAHFRVEGWSDSDFAFANYNLFSWGDSLLTFNQEIPLMEQNWKKSMKGIYKTYKDSTGYYLKTAFDKGTLKVKDSEKASVGGKGLIELIFKSVNLENPSKLDSSFNNLELVVMNIPDESVNLKSATSKGSRRRNLLIKNTFAIKPIFSFHKEPLKFTLEDGKKINKMILEKPLGADKFQEVWVFDNEPQKKEAVRKDKGWWEK